MCYYCKSCVLMLEKTKLNQETKGRQQQQYAVRRPWSFLSTLGDRVPANSQPKTEAEKQQQQQQHQL